MATDRPEDLIDLALRVPGIAPSQNRSEILALLSAVAQLRPRVACEIGSAGGGTLFLFTHVARPDARLLSIDIATDAEREARFRLLTGERQELTVLRADSHDTATVEHFRSWLGGDALDFLFIDGDHSLDGVAEDYRTYGPSVRPGGIVAFHDIVCHGPMRILAAIHPPKATRAILEHLGLPARAPPLSGAVLVDDDTFADRDCPDSP